MEVLVCNEWSIYFHPEFSEQWDEQVKLVKKLKGALSKKEFVEHSEVKLIASLRLCIKEKIPLNPHAAFFRLRKDLKKYRRLKKMGLPERYRLFFKAGNIDNKKVIVVLWLGYPRREGDKKNDCYEKFKRKLASGIFPEDLAELVAQCTQSTSGL
jgi:toxin YhaV